MKGKLVSFTVVGNHFVIELPQENKAKFWKIEKVGRKKEKENESLA